MGGKRSYEWNRKSDSYEKCLLYTENKSIRYKTSRFAVQRRHIYMLKPLSLHNYNSFKDMIQAKEALPRVSMQEHSTRTHKTSKPHIITNQHLLRTFLAVASGCTKPFIKKKLNLINLY